MSEQIHKEPTPRPPLSQEGCKQIREIFSKYDNIDHQQLQQIIDLVRKNVDESEIIRRIRISKNKLYRYISYWMVKNRRNIWVKVSERKRGKNNYNKYNEKIQDIVSGLEDGLTITGLCKFVGLAHSTMIKYLYRLMYLERESIFA
jgi:hypothetical protein